MAAFSLPDPAATAIVKRGVRAEMSDGICLRCDVWLPAGGSKHPTLLQRTAYDKSDAFSSIVLPGLEPLRAVAQGFAVVIQDTRGRYTSEGEYGTFIKDARDGVDTIDWIRAQPFSNGDVCTYGLSHNGLTQLLIASHDPTALRAMAPAQTAADWHDVWTYQGGAFQLGFCLLWASRFLAPAELARRAQAGENIEELGRALRTFASDPWAAYRRLPLIDVSPIAELCPDYIDWLRYPERDDFCAAVGLPGNRMELDLPALHIGGWYDLFLAGTLDNFERLRASSFASQQRLIIGPWAHGSFGESLGDTEFGSSASLASLDPTRIHLGYFSAVLANRPPPDAPVRLFVMGANQWRDEDDWPLTRAIERRLYLRSKGKANSGFGDGRLSFEPARGAEPADGYRFDPDDPVPTCGGASFLPGLITGRPVGPRDQTSIEQRADVLVYTSPPLEEAWEVTGYVTAVLHAATTAVDTDWTAKLVDVHPDGRLLSVCDGIIRARYRAGRTPALVRPGTVERYEVALGATSVLFRTGHRIRLEISSSNFPRFDRNPNTGGVIASTERSDFEVAHQTVFHDADYESFLVLPVVPTL